MWKIFSAQTVILPGINIWHHQALSNLKQEQQLQTSSTNTTHILQYFALQELNSSPQIISNFQQATLVRQSQFALAINHFNVTRTTFPPPKHQSS